MSWFYARLWYGYSEGGLGSVVGSSGMDWGWGERDLDLKAVFLDGMEMGGER